MICVRLATLDDAGVIEHQTSRVERLHSEALPMIFKPPAADLSLPETLVALIQNPIASSPWRKPAATLSATSNGEVVTRVEDEFHQADPYLYIYRIVVDDDARARAQGRR